MMLCGLDAGLTRSDMREMKYTEVVQVIWEWEDMHDTGDRPNVRDATQDDIDWLKSL